MKKSISILIILVLSYGIFMINNYHINNSKINYVVSKNYQPSSIDESIDIATMLDKISLVAKLGYDEFTYPEFTYDEDIERTLLMEKVNKYRDAKRKAGRVYHAIKNYQIFSSLNMRNYESVYVCSLLPFVEITYNQVEYEKSKDEILAKLTSHRDISNVTIQKSLNKKEDKFDVALGEAWAADIYDHSTYTGDGVTVGILETGLVNTAHTNMSGHNIQTYSESGHQGSVTDHATMVASLIGGNTGMAPDATLLSASLYGNVYEEVEWLVNNGADIINMSFGESDPTGIYDSNSAFIDNMVKTYNVVAVAATGNGGNDVGCVTNPALGYNVIGVGAADFNGNVCTFTSNKVYIGPNKPTIVTSGKSLTIANIGSGNSGTSFSSAFASGMIATLLEAHPDLKSRTEMVIAMVCANAYYQSGYNKTENNGMNKYNGAGRFHLEQTIENHNRIWTFTNNEHGNNKLVYQFSAWIDTNHILQASFAWLASANVSEKTPIYNNYYAQIVNSSGTIVAEARSTFSNVLFMRYPVTTYDRYTMQIYSYNHSQTTADKLAFAYRFE